MIEHQEGMIMVKGLAHAGFVLGCFVILLTTVATPGYCQAWVSPKGTGSFSVSYINEYYNTDYFGHGETYIDVPPNPLFPNGYRLQNFGSLRTQGTYLDFAYSFTDKLALTVSLPYFANKYTAAPGPTDAFLGAHQFVDGSVPLDDGQYHGSFQNFAFRLRYNVTARPFMITPYFQFNQPSNDYLFYSHAIVGDHLRSAAIGTYLGGTFGSFLPNAYLQGNYSFSFIQKADMPAGFEQFAQTRHFNQFELEFGYFILPELRAFTVLAAQVTNGGLNAPEDILLPGAPLDSSNPLFFHHTQLTRNNYLDLAFGGQYSLSSRIDVFGLVTHMVTARNMHGLKYGLTFGMSWGFGGSPQRPCHC